MSLLFKESSNSKDIEYEIVVLYGGGGEQTDIHSSVLAANF